MVIEKLLNENHDLFRRVIYNLPMGFLLQYMNNNKKENYALNTNIINEVKINPLILEKLQENIYVDEGLKKLIAINQMEKGTEKYKEMYDDLIQVGQYKIAYSNQE